MRSATQDILKLMIRGWTSAEDVHQETGSKNFAARRNEIEETYQLMVWDPRGYSYSVVFFNGKKYKLISRQRKVVNKYGKKVNIVEWRAVRFTK